MMEPSSSGYDPALIDNVVDTVASRSATNALREFVSTQPTAPEPSLAPRPFSGSIYDRPWRFFLQDLKDWGTLKGFNDARLLAAMPRLLTDAAAIRFRELRNRDPPPTTTAEVDQAMEISFPYARTADHHYDYLRLLQFGQHGFNVETLASKIRQSAAIAVDNADEREKVMNHTFIFSVSKAMRARIVDAGDKLPPTFEESVLRGQRVELNMLRENNGPGISSGNVQTSFAVHGTTRPAATTNDISRLLQQTHIGNNGNNVQRNNNNRGRSSNRSRAQGPGRGRRGGSRRGGNQRRQWQSQWRNSDGTILCYRCLQPGHPVSMCPSPPASEGHQSNFASQQHGQQQAARGRGAARGFSQRSRGNGGRAAMASVINSDVTATSAGGTSDGDNEPLEYFTFDDPSIEAHFVSGPGFNNCCAVLSAMSPKPSAIQRTPASAMSVHSHTASHVTSNASALHVYGRKFDAASKVVHVTCSALRAFGRQHALFGLLLLFSLATAAAATANSKYFAPCSDGRNGQLYAIPQPFECNAAKADGVPQLTMINFWTPAIVSKSVQAFSCTLASRKICSNYGRFFTKIVTSDQTELQPISVADCRNAWSSKKWRGFRIESDGNQHIATQQFTVDFEYCCIDQCAQVETLMLRQGLLSTVDGVLITSDFSVSTSCHWLAGQCMTTQSTMFWDSNQPFAPQCQFQLQRHAEATIAGEFLLVEELQRASRLTASVNACGKTLYLSASGHFIEFDDDSIEQRFRRSNTAPDEETADAERTAEAIEIRFRTFRARARGAQYKYKELLKTDTSSFSTEQLAEHARQLQAQYAELEKYQDYLTTTTTAAPTTAATAATPTATSTAAATTTAATTTAVPKAAVTAATVAASTFSPTSLPTFRSVPTTLKTAAMSPTVPVPAAATQKGKPQPLTVQPAKPQKPVQKPHFPLLQTPQSPVATAQPSQQQAPTLPTTMPPTAAFVPERQPSALVPSTPAAPVANETQPPKVPLAAAEPTEAQIASAPVSIDEPSPVSMPAAQPPVPPEPASIDPRRQLQRFRNQWETYCKNEQSQTATLWALFRIDASAAARILFQQDNVYAVLDGAAFRAWQCPYVEIVQFHWDHRYKGQCFAYTPVETKAGVMFIQPGTHELATTSFNADCNDVSLAPRFEFDQWRSGAGLASVFPVASSSPPLVAVASPNATAKPGTPVTANGGYPAVASRRLQTIEQQLQRIISFASQYAVEPELTARMLRGITAPHFVIAGSESNVKHPYTVNPAEAVSSLQLGFWQVSINIAVLVLVLVLLLQILWQLARLLQKRCRLPAFSLRSRRPPDRDEPSDAPQLQPLLPAPSLAGPTTTVIFPQSLGQLLQSMQAGGSSSTGTRRSNATVRQPAMSRSAAACATAIVAVIGSRFRNPLVDIELNSVPMTAMMDTGASINLISEATFKQFLPELQASKLAAPSLLRPSDTDAVVVTVDGQQLNTIGKVWLNVTANSGNDIQLCVPFTVVADLEIQCILGVDFMSRYPETTFNWRNSFVKLGKTRLPIHGVKYTAKKHRGYVQLQQNIEVPPRTRAIVPGIVQQPYNNWPELLFEGNKEFQDANQLVCAASVAVPLRVDNHTSAIPVEVVNATLQPMQLYKGTTLGKVSTFHSNSIAASVSLKTASPKQSQDIADFAYKVKNLIETDCPHLSKQQQKAAVKLLVRYKPLFSTHPHDVGLTEVVTHSIPTIDNEPVAMRPYKVSMADKPEQDAHIAAMLENDIIEPCNSTMFNAPVFLVHKKTGGTRWIVDFRSLNLKTIAPAYQQLPSIDGILASLGRSSMFGLLDQTWGFYQVLVEPSDRNKTAFSTHSGARYQFRRMPMGLTGSPHTFQKAMNIILSGIPSDRAMAYLDDVIIVGKDFDDFCRNLSEVLDRLLKAGIKLHLDKCRWFQQEIKYLGYVVSNQGLKPDPDKVSSVQNFKLNQSSTVRDVQSFLGLTNFFKRFLKDYATICLPLTNLTRKENKFIWSDACEKAFNQLKTALTTAPVLAFPQFNGKRFILATDASLFAVGAVLMQEDVDNLLRPVAYFSKKLSPTQSRYSAIEREALAITEAVRHFRYIVHKQKLIVFCDHQPLVSLLRKQPGGNLDSPRLTKWALAFQADNIEIRYLPGKENSAADFLSRMQSAEVSAEPPQVDVVAVAVATASPISVPRIRQASSEDPLLSHIIKFVQTNSWPPPEKVTTEQRPFSQRKQSLTVDSGVLMFGSRAVVPSKLRKQVLAEIHETHPGISRMRQLTKSYIWWPGINSDVQQMVESCTHCNEERPNPPEATLHPLPFPSRPFERIHVDFAGPYQQKMWFVCVDAYSKWPEIAIVNNITAATTIRLLRSIFARFGLVEVLASDNATSFTSEEFRSYCRANGIRQALSSPFHPRTNGLAENMVKTLKSAMSSMTEPDLQARLDKFLAFYRQTPHTTTKRSPAELLLSYSPRNRLDLLNPLSNPLSATIQQAHESQARYHDTNHPEREFAVGDPVWFRNFRATGPKWLPGTISRRNGPLSYEVEADGLTLRKHVDQLRRRSHQEVPENDNSDEDQQNQESLDGEASNSTQPLTEQPKPKALPSELRAIPETRKLYPLRSRQVPRPSADSNDNDNSPA